VILSALWERMRNIQFPLTGQISVPQRGLPEAKQYASWTILWRYGRSVIRKQVFDRLWLKALALKQLVRGCRRCEWTVSPNATIC